MANVLFFLAGIGVFLFSTKMLSGSVESLAGNKIRKIFSKIGGNRFKSTGLGFGITFGLQSSSASLVMTMGFLSIGVISLFQGIAINLGANVASAVTSYMVSFGSLPIVEFFMATAVVGAAMQIISKKDIVRKIGNVIIAFSLFFISLYLMRVATTAFRTNDNFIQFFTMLENPILLVLMGVFFTLLIQSSMGTMAILVTLMAAGTAGEPGLLSFQYAVFALYGANLGTAITTALLGGLSSGPAGRRLAVFHFSSRLIFVTFITILTIFTPWIEILNWITNPAIRLATTDVVINVVMALMILPFIKPIAKLLSKLFVSKKKIKDNPLEIMAIDGESNAVAIAKAKEKCIVFYNEMQNLFLKTMAFMQTEEKPRRYANLSKRLNDFMGYSQKLDDYLMKILYGETSFGENILIEKLLLITKQITDGARNCIRILENSVDENKKKLAFPVSKLKPMYKLTENINEVILLIKPYIENSEGGLNPEQRFDLDYIANLVQEISKLKLNAKTSTMKDGFNSANSAKKNTNYLYMLNLITRISNNFVDIGLSFEAEYREKETCSKSELDTTDVSNLIAADEASNSVI